MNNTVLKILFLALTLVLIPATVGASGSHGKNGHRHGEGHRNEKSYHEHDDWHDGENRQHGLRLLSKLHESECSAVEGKWARAICYGYCEALDCDSANPRGSDRACTVLKEKFYARTDATLPCVAPLALSCPCFGDLDSVFNGGTTICSPTTSPTLISDGNGTQVQAVALTEFNACSGVTGQVQMISEEDANGCLGMIENFCALP